MDMGCKGKSGIKDEFKDLNLSNWMTVFSHSRGNGWWENGVDLIGWGAGNQ